MGKQKTVDCLLRFIRFGELEPQTIEQVSKKTSLLVRRDFLLNKKIEAIYEKKQAIFLILLNENYPRKTVQNFIIKFQVLRAVEPAVKTVLQRVDLQLNGLICLAQQILLY